MTMSWDDRTRRRGGVVRPGDGVDANTLAWLREVLADALKSPRLTEWETQFCADMAARAVEQGLALRVSEKQQEALLRIERKIYAAG
jgi:hypothetical protein